jgi:Zn-dependent protease
MASSSGRASSSINWGRDRWKMVGAPMRSVIFTATLPYNEVRRVAGISSRVHVIRGLGEPAANLLLGAVMLILYVAGLDSHFVFFLAVLNLAFFVIAMTPLPTMHGGVVLNHLKAWKQG